MTVLWLHSAYDGPPEPVRAAAAAGRVTVLRQADLTPETLLAHRGLITGNQLDQNAMLALKDALAAFLDAGGRWVFNGHMVRPLVAGLAQYRPIAAPKRPDFDLTAVNAHPILEGIDIKGFETNNGVAGFYGRGCNPPPEGAVVVNGFGPSLVPVDWVWHRPQGGAIFNHAGNDLGQIAAMHGLGAQVWAQIIDWAAGGACLDPAMAVAGGSPQDWPLAQAEAYAGMKSAPEADGRIVAATAGTYYHIHSLEGARYAPKIDLLCSIEDLPGVLAPEDTLWVPCRTPAHRMIAQKETVARHLQAGGTVVALGESRSDLWLPGVRFTGTATNWWWWLTPGADLGVRITDPAHPLLDGITDREVTWHLHGYFDPPEGARVMARDGQGRAILYEDSVSTNGRMIISSLDPVYHHGSHFMTATTRLLDRFLPNLKRLTKAGEPA